MEERELVQRVLQGDEQASREFVETYRDYMYKTCANVLGYKDPDAEDMVQEAFIIAFRKLKEFEFRAPLKSWLAQICAFLCFHHIRKRTRMVMKLDEELEALDQSAASERVSKGYAEEERQDKVDLVRDCLKKLSPDCRSIVELRDQQEKSYADIGKVLSIPIGTVMSRLARCKEALKALVMGFIEEKGQ